MKANKASSSESARHPYLRRGFWLTNRFWYDSDIYSKETRERLDKLILTFEHPNRLMLDLIKTI